MLEVNIIYKGAKGEQYSTRYIYVQTIRVNKTILTLEVQTKYGPLSTVKFYMSNVVDIHIEKYM